MDESQDYSGVYLIWLIFLARTTVETFRSKDENNYEGESLEEVRARELASFGGKTW